MATTRMTVLALLAAGVALGLTAMPACAKTLKVSVDGLKDGQVIPKQYAFCIPAAQGHTAPGLNISPRISWSKGPAGTMSYAIVLSDTDVPTIRDNMNKEGVTVAASMKRRTFFHWVLVDIPANVTSLPKGAESDARVAHGKPATPTKAGVRGVNDYTKVLAGNPAMKGQYYGYDGPCPPWNDEIVHHYHFTVYALSVPTLNLGAGFDGIAAMAAIQGLVLAEGELVGLYAQNPAVIAKLPK